VASAATRLPGVGELLDAAVARLCPALQGLTAATAMVAVPAGLLAASAPLWPRSARPAVVAAPLALALVLAVAACVLLLGDVGIGLETAPATALRRVLRRLPALLGLLALGAVQVALSTLLLVVPGLTRLGGQQVALPVLLLEQVGPRETLRRSRFLLRGQERRALAAQIGALLGAAAVGALPVLAVAVALPLPTAGSEALASTRLIVAALVLAILAVPLVAAVQFVLFAARREALEALDLQLALQALDDATPRRTPVAA